jgi:hypothetical protein
MSIFSLPSIPAHLRVRTRSALPNGLVLYCFATYWSSWQCATGSVRVSSLGSVCDVVWDETMCPWDYGLPAMLQLLLPPFDRRVKTKRRLRRQNSGTATVTTRASHKAELCGKRPWQSSSVVCLRGVRNFVGTFGKLRKATVSLVMSVRPSACNSWAPTGRIFMKLDIREFIENMLR